MSETLLDNVVIAMYEDDGCAVGTYSSGGNSAAVSNSITNNDVVSNSREANSQTIEHCTESTLEHWLDQLTMIHYIYESSQDLYSNIETVMGYAVFILTSVTSFLAIWKVDDIIVAAISLACTVIAAANQVFDLRLKRQLYNSYLNDVHSFLAVLISRKILPTHLRAPAQQVVIENKDTFMRIVSGAPDIPNVLYQRYSERYKRKLVVSHKISQIVRIV